MKSVYMAVITVLLIVLILMLLAWVLTVVAQCFVFKKAGERPWKAIIPFYSQYVQLRFSWSTKMFIPYVVLTVVYWLLGILNSYSVFKINDVVNVIASIVTAVFAIALFIFTLAMNLKLSWSFGHGIPWAILLTFLPFIFYPITAWGKSKYVGADITKFNKLGF